jgi:hypothetical protein
LRSYPDAEAWIIDHLFEDSQQVGYTRLGLKPSHQPLIAGLAEAKLVANYWLRSGNTVCVNGAAEFLRQTMQSLPAHLCGDSGFGDAWRAGRLRGAGFEVSFLWRS